MHNIKWCALLLPWTSKKKHQDKRCACVSLRKQKIMATASCACPSLLRLPKTPIKQSMRELLLPQTFRHDLGSFCLIPGSKTKEQFRNHSRSPRWAVLGAWVVYKNLFFAGSSCLLYPTHLWCFLPKCVSYLPMVSACLLPSQNPHPKTPCVAVVHQICYLIRYEWCMVNTWSIKISSLLGLPVLIILYFRFLFSKMSVPSAHGFRLPPSSQNIPPAKPCVVVVHQNRSLFSHERCLVDTWSIKASSSPGLPVFIITHTSGVFPKHCGI